MRSFSARNSHSHFHLVLTNDWIEDPLFKNLNVSKSGNVSQVNDIIWNTAGGVLAANLMLDDIEEYFLKK